MKLSKKLVAPILAVLIAAGLATVAAPGTASATPLFPRHRPVACKMVGDSFGRFHMEVGCGFQSMATSGVGNDWAYDTSMYTDMKDFSPWEVLNNTKMFPTSDSGYNCTPSDDGSLLCTRSVANAPHPGKDNATLNDLKSEANRGSVMNWHEDDTLSCTTIQGCFKTTVVFPKYTAEAFYTYDSDGNVGVPQVAWFKNDGKDHNGNAGGPGTYIGTRRGFLTTGTAPSDADQTTTPAVATVDAELTPGEVLDAGADARYTLNVGATAEGSAYVRLHLSGLKFASAENVPSDWVSIPTGDPTLVSYYIPDVRVGSSTSAALHFTVTGLTAVSILTDVNSTTATGRVNVRPAAPVCTAADHSADGAAVQPMGDKELPIAGVFCSVQAGSTLQVWSGVEQGVGHVGIVGTGNNRALTYKAPSATYTGVDTQYLVAINAAGSASLPTTLKVDVLPPATAVADSYNAKPGETFTADTAHGVMGNDQFGAGSDGWTVEWGYPPANGTLDTAIDGSFTYTPNAGFSGDDSFRYRLSGPHDAVSKVVTVTIHVAP